MGLLDIFRKTPITEQRSSDVGSNCFGYALNYNGFGTFKTTQSMTLSAVYRCVTVIMNSISTLPVRLYKVDENGYKYELKNNLSYILGKKPNYKMNSNIFYGLIVKDILLSGNAYALILRDGNTIKGLQYVQPGFVTVIDKGDRIEYAVNGIKGNVRQEDILHFMGYTENGVYGLSVLTHAKRTLGIADYGEKSSENFFKSGGCTSGFLKLTSNSTKNQREEIQSAWLQATGGPNNGPNGIPVLPMNVDYQQLSVSPADAQLLESRKFEIIEICRFFSVPPHKVFDMEKASYNNSEMSEITFLNDCLRPLITKIEKEIETKLFGESDFDVKFDISEMLRTDKKSQAEYFTKMFNLGSMSPNDIRRELDMTPVEGGDIYVAQINLTSIKNLETINATADNRLKEPELQENNDKEDDKENQ